MIFRALVGGVLAALAFGTSSVTQASPAVYNIHGESLLAYFPLDGSLVNEANGAHKSTV